MRPRSIRPNPDSTAYLVRTRRECCSSRVSSITSTRIYSDHRSPSVLRYSNPRGPGASMPYRYAAIQNAQLVCQSRRASRRRTITIPAVFWTIPPRRPTAAQDQVGGVGWGATEPSANPQCWVAARSKGGREERPRRERCVLQASCVTTFGVTTFAGFCRPSIASPWGCLAIAEHLGHGGGRIRFPRRTRS